MLRCSRRFLKGEMALNIIHDGNPQYGAPYTTQDRVMREDEFDDFLKSVRGWKVLESGGISKDFHFDDYWLSYDWMGRVMAFAYTSSKYPRLQWKGCTVSVTLYSGHFKGLSNREAVVAAFMNDQWFLIKKAAEQRDNLLAMSADAAKGSGVDVDSLRHPEPALKRRQALSAALRDDATFEDGPAEASVEGKSATR